MIRPFFSLMAVLMLLVGAVVWHYWHFKQEPIDGVLQQMTALTQFVSPVLSVSYYEPRVLLYKKAYNPAYPQMQQLNRMDFVYEE